MLKWKQLKPLVEAQLADSVRGRLQISIPGSDDYLDDEEHGSRPGWVVFDGEPVALFGGRSERSEEYGKALWALLVYVHCSLDQAISSTNVVVRAFAMLDQRLDPTALASLNAESMHPLQRKFLDLRMFAEGFDTSDFSDTVCSPESSTREILCAAC